MKNKHPVLRRFMRRKVSVVAAAVLILFVLIAILGPLFGGLLAGATLVETVFSIPGIGRFVVDSVSNRDYPAIQGAVLVLAVTFVLVNTLVDLLYAAVDPRVKYD